MGVLLILPLLASGFILCLRDKVVFSTLHRYEGQLLYLLVSYQGIRCFIWAAVIVTAGAGLFSHEWTSHCLPWVVVHGSSVCAPAFSTDWMAVGGRLVAEVEPESPLHGQLYFFVTQVALVTCVMPFMLAPLRFWNMRRRLKITSEQTQIFLNISAVEPFPLANMIATSMHNKAALMLTMSDRKVYIGLIQAIGSPTETTGGLENFAMWPMSSGYRDKDTLKVVETYTYPAFDQSVRPVVLRLDNVVSVTPFDDDHRRKVSETVSAPSKSSSLDTRSTQFARLAAAVAVAAYWLGSRNDR